MTTECSGVSHKTVQQWEGECDRDFPPDQMCTHTHGDGCKPGWRHLYVRHRRQTNCGMIPTKDAALLMAFDAPHSGVIAQIGRLIAGESPQWPSMI